MKIYVGKYDRIETFKIERFFETKMNGHVSFKKIALDFIHEKKFKLKIQS